MTELERICYQAYQLDWMISHGISLDEAFRAVIGCVQEATDPDGEVDVSAAIDSFMYDRGFDGIIFAYPDEFLSSEMLDKAYMRPLLERMSKDVREEYEEYIAEKEIADYFSDIEDNYEIDDVKSTDKGVIFNIREWHDDDELGDRYTLLVLPDGRILNRFDVDVLQYMKQFYREGTEPYKHLLHVEARWCA